MAELPQIQVRALTRPCLLLLRHLLPFALCGAFPRSLVGRDSDDYYGSSVPLGLASRRGSHNPSRVYVLAPL